MRGLLLLSCLSALAWGQTASEWAARGRSAYEAEDYGEAVFLFRKAHRLAPDHKLLRTNLATSLLALARQQLDAFDFRAARLTALEAVEVGGENAPLLYLLALISVKASEDERARPWLNKLLELEPLHLRGLELLGYIEYRGNRTAAAVDAWRRIAEESRSEKLLRLLRKAEKDLAIEQGFHGWETTHFNIRSDDAVADPLPKLVGDALEDAYTSVGYRLGVYPERTISVLIYTSETFEELANVDWARGMYDGKIRLAVGGLDEEQRNDLAALLRHEYAHVLIHELSARVPAWVHEGLATWLDGSSVVAAQERLRAAGELPRLAALGRSFTNIKSARQARLAYDLSLCFVERLSDSWGEVRLVDWLRAMNQADDAEAAFEEIFATSVADEEGKLRKELGKEP